MFRPLYTNIGRRVSVPVAGAVAGTVQQRQAQNSVAIQNNRSSLSSSDSEKENHQEQDDFQIINGDDLQQATQTVAKYVDRGQLEDKDDKLDELANSQMTEMREAKRRDIGMILDAGLRMAQNNNVRNTIMAELATDDKLRDSMLRLQDSLNGANTLPQLEYNVDQSSETQDSEDIADEALLQHQKEFQEALRSNLFTIVGYIHKGYVGASRAVSNIFQKIHGFFKRFGQKIRHRVSGVNPEDLDEKDELEYKNIDAAVGLVTTVATVIIMVAVLRKAPTFLFRVVK